MSNINIIHGDCMDYLPKMKDNEFSLAIVDPPYGLGARLHQGGREKQQGRISAAQYAGKAWDTPPGNEFFVELFRVSENQIIWGGNYFGLPPTRGFIIWDKRQPLETFSFGEYAWTSFDKVAKKFDFMYTNYVEGKHPPSSKIHPTQKPVALYKWLLTKYAKPGQTILDTHLGSGSIAIASDVLGFNLTAFEIDLEYIEGATDRLIRHRTQGVLPL